ncbi:squalene/phytoene synthase family protein [Halovulum dunhuangense]|uniref:Squalene/phytoene synthase family protein n=2 Tax=Halovulum dunhuangense TaxID=1505036 RepID=A0A849L3R4_9RHOB|nr:squalene/phytoene synthase family protein [Halovulum dunhuangense]
MRAALDACAARLAGSDPERFAAVMAAPVERRAHLIALYAFNLELARAPWVTSEPMLAEMRVQWWADAVEEIFAGQLPRAHEVVAPLAAAVHETDLPRAPFETLIEARRMDARAEPVADAPDRLWRYLADTGGALMALAAHALGQGALAGLARDYGTIAGAAGYIRALPALEQAGRRALPGSGADAVRELAETALARLDALSRAMPVPRAARPAFIAGGPARAILTAAKADPQAALEGRLALSEFRRRAALLKAGLTGRF